MQPMIRFARLLTSRFRTCVWACSYGAFKPAGAYNQRSFPIRSRMPPDTGFPTARNLINASQCIHIQGL